MALDRLNDRGTCSDGRQARPGHAGDRAVPALVEHHTDTPIADRHHPNPLTPTAAARPIAVTGCRTVLLPKIGGPRGNLTFIEQMRHIPFEIKRMYYLYDVPGGETRGGHAHKKLQQFVIAITGSFDVILDDGVATDVVQMNRSYCGLYIPNMIWRELVNFSSGSVCAVLASDFYEESDYIRDHAEFLEAVSRRAAASLDR
jgi:hypothetical protein